MRGRRRYAVVGGGIAGLSAAWELRRLDPDAEITVYEPGQLGGKLRTSPFAGRPLDEGADAFLARVPEGRELCQELGLAGSLVSPATGVAYVARDRHLHRLPAGLVLGVPTDAAALDGCPLVDADAAARVAAEPSMPGSVLAPGDPDVSIGELIRRRFGDDVLERLVDPLLGGINAGDSDRLSLRAAAPQLAAAAERSPSLVEGLRAVAAEAARTAEAVSTPAEGGAGRGGPAGPAGVGREAVTGRGGPASTASNPAAFGAAGPTGDDVGDDPAGTGTGDDPAGIGGGGDDPAGIGIGIGGGDGDDPAGSGGGDDPAGIGIGGDDPAGIGVGDDPAGSGIVGDGDGGGDDPAGGGGDGPADGDGDRRGVVADGAGGGGPSARGAGRPAAAAPVFWALPEGMASLVDALVAALRTAGVEFVADAVDDLGALDVDGVVLATPAPATARLVQRAGASTAAEALGSIRHASPVLLALAFRRTDVRHSMDGSGFLVPKPEGRIVTACSFATSKWAHLGAADDGLVVLRASAGRDGDDRAFGLDDDVLLPAVLHDLDELLGLGGDPVEVRITRWRNGFPQYEPGHLDRVAAIEADLATVAHPRIAVAGAAYRGVGIPACIRTARAAARHLTTAATP